MKKTVIGSGIYCLDIIVVRDYPEWPKMKPFTDRTVIEEVGGTCGNVMCMLAYLGWKAMPQVKLDDSPQGLKMTSDFKLYGCDCRYVQNTPDGGTTLLKCTHKYNSDGQKTISFYVSAPDGGRFPRRRFLRARDEAPAFLESLDESPGVYFFDDAAAGHRALARALRQKGALVYFEPASINTKADIEAVELSDIVKFSEPHVPGTSFTERYPDKLFIQTMGAEGLRFRLRGGEWIHLAPAPCDKVVDWEGAGDWTTSAFLNNIAETDIPFASLTEEMVAAALEKAQEIAAQSVQFLSSKGMIHDKI